MVTNIRAHSGMIITDISDHFGIFSIIKKREKLNQQQTQRLFRIFSETNMQQFNTLLLNTDFSEVTDAVSVEQAYNNCVHKYLNAYHEAFPMRSKYIPLKLLKRSPWMTRGLIVSSIAKANLLKLKLTHPTLHNINRYKSYWEIYR